MSLIRIRAPKLALRAVKSYRAPAYPKADAHLDFDLQDVSKWPFAPAIASALLASTLVVGSPSIAHAGEEVTAVAASRPREPRSVPNPFAPEQRKLDFGGKGGPMTMPREMALVAIARGFEKSGIQLKSDVHYKKGGVVAQLDGFDRARSIGFEWMQRHGGAGEAKGISAEENTRLDADAAAGKRQIAIIYANDERFTSSYGAGGEEAAQQRLTRAVQEYVDYLRSVGAL